MASEPSFFLVGYVARAHGVLGEIWVNIPRDQGMPRLENVQKLYLGEHYAVYALRSFRFHRGGVLLLLDGCNDRTAAEALRGKNIFVSEQSISELGVDEYYVKDLVGMKVSDEKGDNLGELVEVLPTGANDVYRVVQEGQELLLPAIDSVIRAVDVGNSEMVVRLIRGIRA